MILGVNLNRGLRIYFKSKGNKINSQKHIFHLLSLSYFQVLGEDVRCFTALTWGQSGTKKECEYMATTGISFRAMPLNIKQLSLVNVEISLF